MLYDAHAMSNIRDAALAIVESEMWKDVMRWRAEGDKYGRNTPMKLLIKHMPGLPQHVL